MKYEAEKMTLTFTGVDGKPVDMSDCVTSIDFKPSKIKVPFEPFRGSPHTYGASFDMASESFRDFTKVLIDAFVPRYWQRRELQRRRLLNRQCRAAKRQFKRRCKSTRRWRNWFKHLVAEQMRKQMELRNRQLSKLINSGRATVVYD